ncbi:hypothetical protein AC578_4635 [Pseudocercospora eumusae]|uniref:C2H2-type domain-containing protein n=1 Tax=Pseudocercospora eumusae TaxID=321146 RepID=A0A139H7J1_9PEZI|nr:hypothetical protein AC578_4635 [Pseudocercospora eumusae]
MLHHWQCDPFEPLHTPLRGGRGQKRKGTDSISSVCSNMSGYYYPPSTTSEEQSFDFATLMPMSQTTQSQHPFPAFAPQQFSPPLEQQEFYHDPAQYYQHSSQYHQYQFQVPLQQQQQPWTPPPVPSSFQYAHSSAAPLSQYSDSVDYSQEFIPTGPPRRSTRYLSPDEAGKASYRVSRSTSVAESNASSLHSISDVSRSVSPNASEMAKYGRKNDDGSWSCTYPGCSSKSTFKRGCDLRKHYKRHTKSLWCRHEGCPQASEGGFSSKKDRARHEAKHNPSIVCEWEGCKRLFSRQDNMKDHVRRVHKRRAL